MEAAQKVMLRRLHSGAEITLGQEIVNNKNKQIKTET